MPRSSLFGCSLDIGDTPLGATLAQRGTVLGEHVAGSVENPDGAITVTLAPASAPAPEPGSNSAGADECEYDTDSHDFACSTTGLDAGLYRVEVTDAKFASEGTKTVTVAVTDNSGYQPHIEPAGGSRPGTLTARLQGWEPGRRVTVFVLDADRGRTTKVGSVVPDSAGRASLTTDQVESGRTYAFQGDDGLWDDRARRGLEH